MKIEKVLKDTDGIMSKISCVVKDEVSGISNKLFFSVENKYDSYLVDEVSDSFIISCILPALISGQDIYCETISDTLYLHSETLIYTLSKVWNRPLIRIFPKSIITLEFQPHAVATGFSGGIDSFATYVKHTTHACPEKYRITHLALFNVGAYGKNSVVTDECYRKDTIRAKKFASEVGLPLVLINSNITDIYSDSRIYHYALKSILMISSAVLVLQKLFSTYYISSSYTIERTCFNRMDQSHYENLLTQLLSNKTNIFISEANLNRVQKTELLCKNKYFQKHVYVCASDIYNDMLGTHFNKGKFPNCGECLKCTRTLPTLDYLGVLEDFSDSFDLEKYRQNKMHILKDIYLCSPYDSFKSEILDLMLSKGFKIPTFWVISYYYKRMKHFLYLHKVLKRY